MMRVGRSSALGIALVLAMVLVTAGVSATADEILLPSGSLERTQSIELAYRMDRPTTGTGTIELVWTDAYDRVIEHVSSAFTLTNETDVKFRLDLRRSVGVRNDLHARVRVRQPDAGAPSERDASISFVTPPPDDRWPDYRIIMWQSHEPEQDRSLKRLGVSAAMIEARREGPPVDGAAVAAVLSNDWGCYIENIATDFYSPYHRWLPDHPVNWRFLEAKRLYRENPLDPAAFMRDPSLSDPVWIAKIRQRLDATVRAYAPYRPLYYSLGDETGIGDLAAAWDFDIGAASLAGFREWLKDQYHTLPALNRQWGAEFTNWDLVKPMLTGDAMHRPDSNFSAWADFKAWMDGAFAQAIRSGTEAVHSADRGALAAIEGGQIPGWGGYDYARLATAVDVMDLYDYGDNIELVRSLAPQTIILTTSFGRGPQEAHRVWRQLLRGNRGLILWDEKDEFVGADGALGGRGREAAPDFREITGGLGALLIGSVRHNDPIAILYSPASMRTLWMVDQKPRGDAWVDRSASTEYEDNAIRSATRHYLRTLEHMGLQPRFVSEEEVERGRLGSEGYRVLILPHALALSSEEATEIRRFVEAGGVVVADSEPGQFDQHSRLLASPQLTDLFGGSPDGPVTHPRAGRGWAVYLSLDDQIMHAPSGDRVSPAAIERMAPILKEVGVASPYPLATARGNRPTDVESSIFHDGNVTILALQRDLPSGSPSGERKETVSLRLPRPAYVYDIRGGRPLGKASRVDLALEPVAPAILAITERPLPSPVIDAPRIAHLGDTATIGLSFSSSQPAAKNILRVEIVDPSGRIVPHYSRKLIAHGGTASMLLPLAVNDPIGTWRIRVIDILSGHEAAADLDVRKD
jgi:hypothetical protein